MNSIGFKNFRRFRDFVPIEYNSITFLVGRNNSGKSTLVKALLLIVDYLKSDDISTFSFNQRTLEDTNISTYGRAKSKHAVDDYITFHFSQGSFEFKLTVSGDKDNTTVGVNEFEVRDIKAGFSFTLRPREYSISISNNVDQQNLSIDEEDKLISELADYEKELIIALSSINQKTSQEYIQKNGDLISLRKRISTIKAAKKKEQSQGNFQLQTHYKGINIQEILQEAIQDFSAEYDVQYREIQGGKKAKATFEGFKAFKDNKFKVERSVDDFLLFRKEVHNIYLGASLNKQSALFSIRDKLNPLSQSIHEFKQLGVDKNQNGAAYQFILKWMGEEFFAIGESFDVVMHAGEAYELIIHDGDLSIHLADKGMGSIQIMLLLIRLSTIIFKQKIDQHLYTVIIEEPELNLHPAFQSKLSFLFYDVSINHGINFIVETHSEYMIRKTQVIVNENEFTDIDSRNPFSVIYFDMDSTQWKMNYRADGRFIEEFGSGFFDETRKLVKKIL